LTELPTPTPSREWKICFVQPKASAYFFPTSGIVGGGSERQVHLLSRALAKVPGLKVHVCLADPGKAFAEVVDGVRLWRGMDLKAPRLLQVFHLRKTLKAIGADVYFFRSPDLGVAVGAFLVRSLGRPFVYQISSNVELSLAGLGNVCGFLGSRGMRWVYAKALGILAQTMDQADRLERDFGKKPLGIQPNLFLPPAIEDRSLSDRTSVLWVGRCDPIKRGPLFMDLARAFPDIPFVMVCPPVRGWEGLFREWEGLATQVENLEWIGSPCAGEELWKHYFSARALVMTSESEGYSNVMMEAWYAELPLLTTHINPDGILTSKKLGCVASGDGADLKEKLRSLLANPVEERAMGRRAREFLSEHHGLRVCVNRFRDHLEVLGSRVGEWGHKA